MPTSESVRRGIMLLTAKLASVSPVPTIPNSIPGVSPAPSAAIAFSRSIAMCSLCGRESCIVAPGLPPASSMMLR